VQKNKAPDAVWRPGLQGEEQVRGRQEIWPPKNEKSRGKEPRLQKFVFYDIHLFSFFGGTAFGCIEGC
ncbi:MAG: hypothetical protein QJR05_12270, partial [Thermoanaerobacterium sp.]|nr:hypothetical protein [Thermoanaerobacterium sp.]